MRPLRGRLGTLAGSRVAQNAAALYASQFLLAIVPLITFPWIARALGPAELGEVAFVQSFGWLVATVGEYGFRFSGTRAVARVRDDPDRLAETVAGVMGAKLMLTGVVTLISLAAYALVPRFQDDPVLLLFGWLLGVFQGLDPLWYFAGVERLRLTAGFDSAMRILTAAAIIAFIHEPGQGNLVLAIWTAGFMVSSLTLTAIMYRSVRPLPPRLGRAAAALREGRALFANTAATSLYTAATVFLLGIVATNVQLGIFAAAERIVRAAIRSLSPIQSAVFPRVSYLLEGGDEDRAQRLSTLALAALTAIGLATGGFLFVLSDVIVDVLFGDELEGAAAVMRVLALLLPLVAISRLLPGLWLLPRGFDGLTLRVTIAAGVSNVVLCLVLGSLYGGIGAAWGLVAVEVGSVILLVVTIQRRGLFPTAAQALGRRPSSEKA